MTEKGCLSKSQSKGRYFFLPLSSNPSDYNSSFELYESGNLLVTFSRKTIREDLRRVGRGENWIGSILRLLDKYYPIPAVPYSNYRPTLDRIGEDKLVDYLRSKGFRVVKNLDVSDRDIVRYLESRGYLVEGILDDVYYSSPVKNTKNIESEVKL